jgi:F-type H+-transporting ATPase subunit delta
MKKEAITHHAQALLAMTNGLSPENVHGAVEKFVLYIRAKGYTSYLPLILKRYLTLYNREHNIQEVYVPTAYHLASTERTTMLETINKKITAASIELHEIVDPTLLGGMKIKIGDTVYDGSVRNTLTQLQASLTQ